MIFKPISHFCNLPFIALLLQNIETHTAKDTQHYGSLCRKKKRIRSMGEGAVVLEVLTEALSEDHGCLFIDFYRLWTLYLNPIQQPWGRIRLLGSHQPQTQHFILHNAQAKLHHPKSLLHTWITGSDFSMSHITYILSLFTSNLSSLCYFKVGKSDEEACGLFVPQAERQIAVPPIFTIFPLSHKSLTTQK